MDHAHIHVPASKLGVSIGSPGVSLLRMAAVERLGIAACLVGMLWGAVWWAMS